MYRHVQSGFKITKPSRQSRSYLHCWSRRCVIQHVGADVEDLQQVGEELLHHGHQGALRQACPGFLHLISTSAGVCAAVFLSSPGVAHTFRSYSWEDERETASSVRGHRLSLKSQTVLSHVCRCMIKAVRLPTSKQIARKQKCILVCREIEWKPGRGE